MIVACNNKNKSWCPFGEEECVCDCYYPFELGNRDRDFSCIDKNLVWRDCYLEEVLSEDEKLKRKTKKQILTREINALEKKIMDDSLRLRELKILRATLDN